MTRRPAPPSGTSAPREATTPSGTIDLVSLADEICLRYDAAYPDERDRYGPAGRAWCVHDNQHLLAWAIGDVHARVVDLLEQVAWLGRVLEARDFPLERLAHDLEIAGDVVAMRLADEAVAARLRAAAAFVRERGSFGINRLWDEMDRVGPGLDLPLYGGSYRPRPR